MLLRLNCRINQFHVTGLFLYPSKHKTSGCLRFSGGLERSHQMCSIKKGALRNFIKLIGKHLCHSLFFNKVAGLGIFEVTWISDSTSPPPSQKTFSLIS